MLESPTQAPYKYDLKVKGSILELTATGYLDGTQSASYLANLESEIDSLLRRSGGSKIGLLFIDALDGFETGRVARVHGEWFSRMTPKLGRIAVVSDKTKVTLGLSVVRLLTKIAVKQFGDVDEARRWLGAS